MKTEANVVRAAKSPGAQLLQSRNSGWAAIRRRISHKTAEGIHTSRRHRAAMQQREAEVRRTTEAEDLEEGNMEEETQDESTPDTDRNINLESDEPVSIETQS